MKAKILAFLGLIITTAVGVSLLSNPSTVLAQGEQYKWLNPTTIQASGGRYNDVTAAKNGVLDFHAASGFSVTSKGSCTITITIANISADNTTAKLVTNGCSSVLQGNDFDRNLTLANPQNGPISYANANCNNPAQNRGDATKCAAVQACIKVPLAASDCASAYDTCITNHTKNGTISSTDKKNCIDNVSSGNLSAANADTTNNQTSCAIQGIGWIVCPVTNFLAKVVDAAYGFVANLLTVEPLYTPGGNNSTGSASADAASKSVFDAWSIMRNLANGAFVIAFLIIIFSQVTSIGISNYGIKRMLPRLIISAVLVNLSYWICAIAIDVSNILGTSITGLFEYLKSSVALPNFPDSTTGNGWEGIAGLILAGAGIAAGAIYIGLSALIPMLLAALLAILTVFLVLALRQALIILLIIISPLAFVAYLLPNTETWFKKWRDLLQTLLLMFPIISSIFGASALASKVVIGTARGNYAIAIQLMGAGIAIIPLAITPIVMKSAGGLLNRFGGFVNNPNRGPFDRARKAAAGYRENRQQYRQLKALNGYRTLPGRGVRARMQNNREAVLSTRKAELSRSKTAKIAELAASDEGFRKKLAQGGMPGADERALAQAINVQAKLKADEVTAATAIIKNANIDNDIEALQDLAKGGQITLPDGSKLSAPAGSALQTAAIQRQFKIGDVGKTDELVMGSANMDVDQRQAIAEGMAGMSSKVAYYGGSSAAKVAAGSVGSEAALNDMVADTLDKGKVSKDTFANGDKDALERMSKVVAGFKAKDSTGSYVTSSVSSATKATVQKLALDTLSDKRLTPKDQNVKRLNDMAAGNAFTGIPGDPKNKETFKGMIP